MMIEVAKTSIQDFAGSGPFMSRVQSIILSDISRLPVQYRKC